MREICLDTETTGLDPRDGHRIVEIGCVELVNKVKTGASYHVYINPEREVPEEAFKVHGLSTSFLKDKPTFKEVAIAFTEFVRDARLVIHNASFDMKFINHELLKCGLEIIERVWVTDSLELARSKFPGAPNSLDALCKRFNIDNSRRLKHGALLDAELLADVYLELMGGSQTSIFELKSAQVTNSLLEEPVINKEKKFRTPRPFPPSPLELTAHEEFIKQYFKDNLWGY